uniref:Uncharacterized protein n=1 Tax=Arundo donax TaxID=35708 RepID=A0A0A9C9A9_ARUDO
MSVFSCASSHSSLLSIIFQCVGSRLLPNSRPRVLTANGEPLNFGSISLPILSNSG